MMFRTPLNKLKNLSIPSILVWFTLALTQSACTAQPVETKAQMLVFGTLVQITTYTHNKTQAEKAIHAVETRFQQFHHEWHAWEKGGIVSKMNQAIQQQQPIQIADSVKEFILKSQQLAKQSDYLFDPGIGTLIALWGFHSEHWQGPPPSATQIAHWLKSRPSIADLYFKDNLLYSRNSDVSLDFGGNAKGLALDIAIQELRAEGIENAVVNIGGDMRAIGHKNGRDVWAIGIQDPSDPQRALAEVDLSGDLSIVTSGTYQRYFEWQGQRFSHILNPNSGYPATGLVSVTVIHPDATTADAAATALLIAGPQHWREIARKMGIQEVLVIDENGQIQQTKAMEKRTKLL
ncbi:FAD:protein FMN transferase [Thiomicrorhabdus cannonii]|uniref:FAD:protein FMN transferase n=1 Tax=Thiomicrorhabdus cannonii TaxID=2748011 RepID=UPI001FE4A6EE|nr:FAD:protein FMN transferase [Thiomicrorhabdus cannonii]